MEIFGIELFKELFNGEDFVNLYSNFLSISFFLLY